MADIKRLADSARQKLRTRAALTYPDAARKAILAKGITNPSDLKRLTRQVLAELGSRASRTGLAPGVVFDK